MYKKYHATRCTECDLDLTETSAVWIHVSVEGHEFEVESEVEANGLLKDRSHVIANGYHAGTQCRRCLALCEELEPAVKRFTWNDLMTEILNGRSDIGSEYPEEMANQDVTICDMNGEFFRCLSFEKVIVNDVLDRGHWFLRMEKVKGEPDLAEEIEEIFSREKEKPLPIPAEVAKLVHELMVQVNVRPPSKSSGLEKQSACRRAANMLTHLAAEVVSLQEEK